MNASEGDPFHCPLCRRPNDCGMAEGSGFCWCFDTSVPPATSARLRTEETPQACLCRNCLSGRRQAAELFEQMNDHLRIWR